MQKKCDVREALLQEDFHRFSMLHNLFFTAIFGQDYTNLGLLAVADLMP